MRPEVREAGEYQTILGGKLGILTTAAIVGFTGYDQIEFLASFVRSEIFPNCLSLEESYNLSHLTIWQCVLETASNLLRLMLEV